MRDAGSIPAVSIGRESDTVPASLPVVCKVAHISVGKNARVTNPTCYIVALDDSEALTFG